MIPEDSSDAEIVSGIALSTVGSKLLDVPIADKNSAPILFEITAGDYNGCSVGVSIGRERN